MNGENLKKELYWKKHKNKEPRKEALLNLTLLDKCFIKKIER